MTLPSLRDQRPWTREFIIFGLFVLLTLVMTWPWVTHLRDATTDPGDPYLNSWILWWDYHQTFHNPLHLFDGNIYFPYRYSLAFSEHNYGIALLCFPLFAAGLRPLTVNGIATLLGFAFSGYGMFRLARTITGCTGPAILAGLTFAFAPYRFEQIFHLNYLFAGWIPVLLEALLLFTRTRSRKAAVWLGVAFLMNGLTCVHWFVLTLIPLALSAAFLLFHYRAWRDLAYWKRAIPAVCAAGLALLPFFVPYKRAGELYGFVRSAEDALIYSATYSDWLVGSFLNKMWSTLHASARKGERALFPGVVPVAIATFALVGALLHAWGARSVDVLKRPHRKTTLILDASLIVLTILTLKVAVTGFLKIRIAGFYLLKLYSVIPLVLLLASVLAIRLLLSRSQIRQPRDVSIRQLGFFQRIPEGFALALIWLVTGFFGSLGMNFFFHRLLFEYIPLFHSIRVPARWATPAYVGLALLVAIGAKYAGNLLRSHWPAFRPLLAYGVLALCMLFEQRAFPLELIHGAVDPDALTLRLKQTPMKGGIVELPTRYGSRANYEYVLRAADHAQPLITAFSGFEPPLSKDIENASNESPIRESFLDLLERIPCSYLVVHNDFLGPARRAVLEQFLREGITTGRVRFIRTYEGADLYAIAKNEPNAISEGPLPFLPQPPTSISLLDRSSNNSGTNRIDDARFFARMLYLDFVGREPDAEGLDYWTRQVEECTNASSCADQKVAVADAFLTSPEVEKTDFFTVRLFKATLGRAPRFQEFENTKAKLMKAGATLEENQNSLIEDWLQSPEVLRLYSSHLEPDQFVDALLRTVKETSPTTLDDERQQLIEQLNQTRNRATIVKRIVDDPKLIRAEEDRAFVLLQYFVFLKRDPNQNEYEYWLGMLREGGDRRRIVATFITSAEYRNRFIANSQ